MKKIKNIVKLSLLAVVMVTSSCSDFLDVNKDPNRVTGDNVTPDLIFTQAENAIGRRQATRFVFMNNWMGYWGRSGTFIVEQEETSYQIANTFPETNWDQAYDILFDLSQVKAKALASKDSVLAGAATVLSVKLWQETVDQFGAIPYSKALDYTNPTPAYDQPAAIYADLLVQLDNAVKYLKASPSSIFGKTDIIFGRGGKGNAAVAQWNKFANTIRLRILIRQSAKLTSIPTAELAKITSNGGCLIAGENVSVNPGYSNATDKQNPFYGAFGLTPSGSAATTNNTPNNYFAKKILGTTDPRLNQVFGVNSKGLIEGTDYGAQNGSLSGTVVVGSGIGPGLLKTAADDQFIFPAFESLFLQAEAAARGWLTGDPQTLFNEAIAESFTWLQVPNASAAATTYETNVNSANWANSGNSIDSKVMFINYQKYIALCGVDPVEAWSDLRRGVLVLPAGYLSNNPTAAASLPNVLTYPQSEFTTNSANIPAPNRKTGTIFTEKLFWQP